MTVLAKTSSNLLETYSMRLVCYLVNKLGSLLIGVAILLSHIPHPIRVKVCSIQQLLRLLILSEYAELFSYSQPK
jgi:hypothetical protein